MYETKINDTEPIFTTDNYLKLCERKDWSVKSCDSKLQTECSSTGSPDYDKNKKEENMVDPLKPPKSPVDEGMSIIIGKKLPVFFIVLVHILFG